MALKSGSRAALRMNQRRARVLLSVVTLSAASLFTLWSLAPSLPAEDFARHQRTRIDRDSPVLNGHLPRIKIPAATGSCVPAVVNLSSVLPLPETADVSLVALYEVVSDKLNDLPPPPEFHGDHQKLCNPAYHDSLNWGYCLPIRGRAQGPRCRNTSEWSWRELIDLAASGQVMDEAPESDEKEADQVDDGYGDDFSNRDEYDDRDQEMTVYRDYDEEDEDPYQPDDVIYSDEVGIRSPCVFSSVLHLLMVEVFDTLRSHGLQPALLFGSMLGAVRDESVIPFTEDADVGFRKNLKKKLVMKRVKDELLSRGYHMFKDSIYRVCVAPSHPLAGFLYDHSVSRRRMHRVPYVDLYAMTPEDDEERWKIDRTWNSSYRIERRDFEPYRKVQVNGVEFDTLANPHAFLVEEYGRDYLTPKPRS